jgi:lysozyme
MRISRRRFLAAAGGAVAAGVGAAVLASGPDYPVQGIDVSHWQGNIDWFSVANSGIAFAFAKATEGLTYMDPQFDTNWANMQAAGIIRGAYHFGHPGSDPIAQADFFLNTVQPVSGDLQMMLDLEVTDGQTPAQVWNWTQAFIGEIQAQTGAPGIIYTGFYFWRDRVGNPLNNLNCPFFLAAYVSNPDPYVPPAWSTWSFWQYSDTGRVPGISGNVDTDAWNGSIDNLYNLQLP